MSGALVIHPRLYGAANMPHDDSATVGGAISTSFGIDFSDVSAATTLLYYSEVTETINVVVTGRDTTNSERAGQAVVPTVTGAAEGTPITFNELMQAVKSAGANGGIAVLRSTATVTGTSAGGANATATSPAYIIVSNANAVKTGMVVRITNNLPVGAQYQLRKVIAISGTTLYVDHDWGQVPVGGSTQYSVSEGMYFEITPNEILTVARPIWDALSNPLGGATKNIYSKMFYLNTNVTVDVLNALVSLIDPTGDLTFALCSAVGDNATAANRVTLPTNQGGGALTFDTSPKNCVASKLVHGNSVGQSQGIWFKLALPGGTAAINAAAVPAFTGSSA